MNEEAEDSRLAPSSQKSSSLRWEEDDPSRGVRPESGFLAFFRLLVEEALFLYDFGLHCYLLYALPLRTVTHYVATLALGSVVALQLLATYAVMLRHVMRIRGHKKPRCGREPTTGRVHCAGVELGCARAERMRGWTALSLLIFLGPAGVLALDVLVLLRTIGLSRCICVESHPELDAAIGAYRHARMSVFALTESLIAGVLVGIVLSSHALFHHGLHNVVVIDALRVDSEIDWRVLAASAGCSVAQVLLHVVRPAVVALRRRRGFIHHALDLGGDAPLAEIRLGFVRAITLQEMPVGHELDLLVAAIQAGRRVREVGVIALRKPLLVGEWPDHPSGEVVRLLTAMLHGDREVTLLNCSHRRLVSWHTRALAAALKVNKTLLELHLNKNEASDAGAMAIAEAVRTHPALQVLDLSENGVTDEGALAIADAIIAATAGARAQCPLLALGLRGNRVTDRGAVALARAMRTKGVKIEALRLDRNLVADEGGIAIADAISHGAPLIELRLDGNAKLSDAAVHALSDAVRASKRIQELDLSGTGIRAAGARALGAAAKDSRTLRVLRLATNPPIGASGVGALLGQALLSRHCALQEIDLENAQLPAAELSGLARALASNRTLRVLAASGNRTNRTFGALLAKALEENRQLRDVRLDKCALDSSALSALFVALRVHGSLRTLHISSNALTARALDELATTLKGDQGSSAGLHALHLDDTALGDTGAKLVARALEKNKALHVLSVRANGITDTGARYFAEMLRGRNRTLRELDLGSNAIGDPGSSSIAHALRENQGLTLLALDRNAVSDKGAHELAAVVTSAAPALRTLLVESSQLTTVGSQALGVAVRRRSTFIYVDAVHERPLQKQLTRLASRAELSQSDRRQHQRRARHEDTSWAEAAEDSRRASEVADMIERAAQNDEEDADLDLRRAPRDAKLF